MGGREVREPRDRKPIHHRVLHICSDEKRAASLSDRLAERSLRTVAFPDETAAGYLASHRVPAFVRIFTCLSTPSFAGSLEPPIDFSA